VVDAAPERPDRGALAIYLLRVSPTEIDPREPFEAEFKIVNARPVSIELPVSPHLSDLQPSDESLDFHYFSLTLFARIQPEASVVPEWRPSSPQQRSRRCVELQRPA